MEFQTKYFGEIKVKESDLYIFPEGLPGFEDKRKFVLINNTSSNSPFRWLQSIEEASLAFVLIDPFSVVPEYEVDIPDDDIAVLKIKDINDVLLLSVVVVPEDIKKMSANLLAPIIINNANNTAKQVTLNTDKYSIRHYIFEKLNNIGGVTDAGSDKKEK